MARKPAALSGHPWLTRLRETLARWSTRDSAGRRLAGDATWASLEALGSRGANLLAMMLAARLLGTAGFGALTVVVGTVTLAASFLSEAMKFTAATQVASTRHRDSRARSSVIALTTWTTVAGSFALALTVFLGARPLAGTALHSLELTDELRLASLILLLEALGGLQQGILSGLREFRSLAVAGAIRGALLIPTVWIGARTAGPTGVIDALIASGALALLLRGWTIARALQKQQLSVLAPVTAADLAILWRVSVPSILVSCIWVPVNWAGMVMLVNSPDGYAQMGLLGAANQWFAALLFLPNILSSVMLPLLSETFARPGEQSVSAAVGLSLRTSLLVSLPAAGVVAAASPWIMSTYGPQFVHGWPTLVVIALTAVVASTLNLTANLLAAAGRMHDVLAGQFLWAVVYLAAAYVLLQASLGATAIAGAMLAGNLAKLLLNVQRARGLMVAPVSAG